jgi:hypothetical protein
LIVEAGTDRRAVLTRTAPGAVPLTVAAIPVQWWSALGQNRSVTPRRINAVNFVRYVAFPMIAV